MNAFRDQILQGKVALVAGASGGINLAIARRLRQHGARVTILSRDPQRIATAAAGIDPAGLDVMGLAADVRDFDAMDDAFKQTVQRFGKLDIVISGAAGNFMAPAAGLSANGFKTVVEIDLIGTFNVFRASHPYLVTPGAALIAISAPQGSNAIMYQAHACAAKAGVNMLTQCLAMEWGPAGIRVNAISPGPIAGTEGMARLASSPAAEHMVKSRLPLRHYGSTDDIADMALFLVSDNARFITGAIMDCDGGSRLGDASAGAETSSAIPVIRTP